MAKMLPAHHHKCCGPTKSRSLGKYGALRIEQALGVKMDTLMRMQASYHISQTRKRRNGFTSGASINSSRIKSGVSDLHYCLLHLLSSHELFAAKFATSLPVGSCIPYNTGSYLHIGTLRLTRHPSNLEPSEIFSSTWLLQAGVLRLNFLEDGNVGVCVFPKREKICVGSPGLVLVSCECVGAPKLHLGQRANGIAYNDAAVI